MKHRVATPDDCAVLSRLNAHLIRDEGHRNPMTITQIEERMRRWLTSGEYRAILFEDDGKVVAYALFRETDAEIHLRQFFVVARRRREGIGRAAMTQLVSNIWSQSKRLTVSVLVSNAPAVAFWRSMGYTDYDLTLEIMPGQRQPAAPTP